MAHFAEIDSNNKVVRVLVVADENAADGHNFLANTLGLGGTWVQTSYNTRGGVHYGADGKPDGKEQIGFNYAGIGYSYDATDKAFYAPQPFPSWTLNKTSYTWEAPVAYPSDQKPYAWNEETKAWDPIEMPTPPTA
jgi:hypothetical protein